MGLYALLARVGLPKGYGGKIMLVVFVGTHLPPVALVLYFLLVSPSGFRTHLAVLAILLVATLLGFVATLFALRSLLAPVRLVSSSLQTYLQDERTKPELPMGFSDEAGRLMADVQYTIDHLDSTIRSLEGLAGTDHLTGLPNRRQGEERLAEDLARAKRGGALLTVAMIDIDNFKAVNDTHGHQAGDVCIRHVAELIRRNVREGDWMARWGGDEFVLALWDASVFASPEAMLRRINRDLRESPVRLPLGEKLFLSTSVGAHRYGGEQDARELLAKADAAMYEAKREGRAWVLSD